MRGRSLLPALGVAVLLVIPGYARGETKSNPPNEPPPSGVTTVDPKLAGTAGPHANLPTVIGSALGFTVNGLVSANVGSLARPQVEPSVASEPANRNVMVAGYSDYVVDVIPGVSRSTNGGKTWAAPTGGAQNGA